MTIIAAVRSRSRPGREAPSPAAMEAARSRASISPAVCCFARKMRRRSSGVSRPIRQFGWSGIMRRYGAFARAPCIDEGVDRIQSRGEEMKTMEATHLLQTYRDVVARLQNEAAVPTADAASSDFLDLAQSVEHQELARLTATRLAERAKRLHIALTRMADSEYEVCSECGTSIPRKRLLAIPDATTCVACQEQLERAGS